MDDRRSAEQEDEARRTAALMGFIVVLLLAIAGIVLVRELGKKSQLEDCLMAGRHNCAPIEVPLAR
jgi:putative Ca2+/H+ antiporter (TMEM165/GDT1 family)